MNGYLLDTHVVLWWLSDPTKLTKISREAITDTSHTIYVSAAVAWEIAIKQARGRLDAPDNLIEVLQQNSFLSLPITIPHALKVAALPDHHQDPFDRIMVAQAQDDDLVLVTHDAMIQKYDVAILRA